MSWRWLQLHHQIAGPCNYVGFVQLVVSLDNISNFVIGRTSPPDNEYLDQGELDDHSRVI